MNAASSEFLVSHGKIGGVGRFLAKVPLSLERGTRVVVRSPRGVEVGAVLCAANERHARLLPTTVVGDLLGPCSDEDAARLEDLAQRGQQVFEDARRLGRELGLPLEIIDVDMMYDGRQAIVQCLIAQTCDAEALVVSLQDHHGIAVLLENLAVPASSEDESTDGGCGEPNCGRANGGSCSTCSTGGCSSCGTGKVDMSDYFAHLRTKMEAERRVPLL